MPWRCFNGEVPKFPLGLAAKLAKEARPKREEVLDLVRGYHELYDQATRMESEINGLKADNLRLKHENEFMLRLVNERSNKE